jgi:hypothetical protein
MTNESTSLRVQCLSFLANSQENQGKKHILKKYFSPFTEERYLGRVINKESKIRFETNVNIIYYHIQRL